MTQAEQHITVEENLGYSSCALCGKRRRVYRVREYSDGDDSGTLNILCARCIEWTRESYAALTEKHG